MHVIRLREPWAAAIVSPELAMSTSSMRDATVENDPIATETAAVKMLVYTRKFHRPTDANDQTIRLRMVFKPSVDPQMSSHIKVWVNGVEAQPVARDLLEQDSTASDLAAEERHFELVDLAPFNQLELRLPAPELDGDQAPPFSASLIQSVELQIQ